MALEAGDLMDWPLEDAQHFPWIIIFCLVSRLWPFAHAFWLFMEVFHLLVDMAGHHSLLAKLPGWRGMCWAVDFLKPHKRDCDIIKNILLDLAKLRGSTQTSLIARLHQFTAANIWSCLYCPTFVLPNQEISYQGLPLSIWHLKREDF